MSFFKLSLFSLVVLLNFSIVNCMESFPQKLVEICQQKEKEQGHRDHHCKVLKDIFECAGASSKNAKEYCKHCVNSSDWSVAYHTGNVTEELSVKEGAELLKEIRCRMEKNRSHASSCPCCSF